MRIVSTRMRERVTFSGRRTVRMWKAHGEGTMAAEACFETFAAVGYCIAGAESDE